MMLELSKALFISKDTLESNFELNKVFCNAMKKFEIIRSIYGKDKLTIKQW